MFFIIRYLLLPYNFSSVSKFFDCPILKLLLQKLFIELIFSKIKIKNKWKPFLVLITAKLSIVHINNQS